jgi:hypothetical protein
MSTNRGEKNKWLDVTARSSQMSRGSSLLFKNKNSKNADSPNYHRVLKQPDGSTFWILLWPRTCKCETVLEVKLVPKN